VKLRLRKVEYVFLAVAVLSVVSFGCWLQNELGWAARMRSQRESNARLECAGIETIIYGQDEPDTIWCGPVGLPRVRLQGKADPQKS